jgi:hypothetical protein
LLRGPDTEELKSDLAKVEQRLRRLDAEDTFSPGERRLEQLYFLHWRKRLHFLLTRKKEVSFKALRQDIEDAMGPSLDPVKPDESWKVITPRVLLRAVLKIREDFAQLCGVQRNSFGDQCFKDLHDLAFGITEPAVFKNYFYRCIGEIQRIVIHAFGRFLQIALSQQGFIRSASVHWASLQVTDLIEREDRLIEGWIKSVCDKPGNVGTEGSQDFIEKVIFRTDWRAPQWLIMQPNGNLVYDPSAAWKRMNENDTRDLLRHFRENCWILLLESTLENVASLTYETLAKKSTSPEKSQEESPRAATQRPATTTHSLQKPLMLKYRSGIKRAILGALTHNPRATDAEVCRSLDADGGEELPPGWRTRKDDRSFYDAYARTRTRRKIEITISKVRRDLRIRGLLQ